MADLGMEKRPLRFSLPEAFFEGTSFFMIEAKGVGEEVRGRLSGHGFSTEGREERRRMRSEFPRWGNERADESHTRAFCGVPQRREKRLGNGVKNPNGSEVDCRWSYL